LDRVSVFEEFVNQNGKINCLLPSLYSIDLENFIKYITVLHPHMFVNSFIYNIMPVICKFSSYSSEMQTSSLFISLIQHHAPEWSSIHTTKIFVLFFPFLPSTSLAAIARGTITRTLFTSTPPPAQKKKKKTTIKEKKNYQLDVFAPQILESSFMIGFSLIFSSLSMCHFLVILSACNQKL
jgi:hypothetical protein